MALKRTQVNNKVTLRKQYTKTIKYVFYKIINSIMMVTKANLKSKTCHSKEQLQTVFKEHKEDMNE